MRPLKSITEDCRIVVSGIKETVEDYMKYLQGILHYTSDVIRSTAMKGEEDPIIANLLVAGLMQLIISKKHKRTIIQLINNNK